MTDALPPDSPAPTSKGRERLRLLVVWGVTLALVAYVAGTTDLETFGEALLKASPLLVLGLTLVEVLAAWAYDSLAITWLVRRFHAPVTYREILPIKGASLLLNVINYNAGVLGIAYFLRDRRRVPFLETTGSMLLMSGVDLFVMAVFMGLGWMAFGDGLDPALGAIVLTVAPVMIVGFLANIAFWKLEPRLTFLHAVTRRALFASFRKADLDAWGRLVLLRVGLFGVYFTYQFLILHVFDVRATLGMLLVSYPIMVFVGTLPISVSGFGSTQLAARFLWAPFVVGTVAHADAVIDAATTASLTGFLLWRVGVGLLCLPAARRS